MDKNSIWKIALILVLTVFAVLELGPTRDPETGQWEFVNLKAGLDIAGGTSLIYEIDASDLKGQERKGLAQRMVPILMRRIDPGNIANLRMIPQGDTRIEIQLPLSSEDTKQRREAYENALQALEAENLNLIQVRRSLQLPADERQAAFEQFADASPQRQEIFQELIQVYDALSAMQAQRDQMAEQMEGVLAKLGELNLQPEFVRAMASQWSQLGDEERAQRIQRHVETLLGNRQNLEAEEKTNLTEQGISLIREYIQAFQGWAEATNELTREETGLYDQWDRATARLQELNLNITQLVDVLEMNPGSPRRQERIDQIAAQFPDRAEQIQAVVETFAQYRDVRGRLDDPEDLKRMLRGAGVLEFRILPTSGGTGGPSASELQAYVDALQEKGPNLASDNRYQWVEVEDPEAFGARSDVVMGQFGDTLYVLASNLPGERMLHGTDPQWQLKKARPTTDDVGRRAIAFSLDPAGGKLFYNVTKNNIGRPLAILLDEQVISAPNVDDAIGANGIIRGTFTQLEVDDMVNKLNAGSFPARLSEVPISEKSIGATIGAENRDQGIRAAVIGLIAVAAFMAIYYFRAGLIADTALILNLLFVLAMMAMLRATFTLPGIAGLILTIGMSVDANVLIFERIREEQERGSPIRTAIANGYGRALRTIVDANVTTFIVALILYMVASEEIKGFAIVLMLGIISSMFTALFVTRVIFNVQLAGGLLKKHLSMLKMVGEPKISWMGLRPVFFAISAILVIGGVSVFFARNDDRNSKYDIEFTGGTSVQVDFKAGAPFENAEQVRQEIVEVAAAMENDDLAAAQVYSIGQTGLQYEITTTETNKTRGTVTFTESGQTADTVRTAVLDAADELGASLFKLQVDAMDATTFRISIGQVNEGMLQSVLAEAFKDTQAVVSNVEVDQVVTEAIQKAFGDLLAVRDDLGADIVSVERVADTDVELPQYLGGVKITVQLARETTAGELRTRLRDLWFKPDMEDLARYPNAILGPDLQRLPDDARLTRFVYVAVHPEAGYRELDENEWARFVENEQTKVMAAASLETSLARVTQVDPSIGGEAKTRALIAIILSLIAIVGYIWIRFGTARYGFAAIAALVHDVCITTGAVVGAYYLAGTSIGEMLLISDFKINLQIIAALLTIIGYSLNDTIVVFDRIRENRGKLTTLTPEIISSSINQTLSRTLLTSLTTFMVVLVMYLWGGPGLRGFTFALLIGIIVGTYSSIAIAAPILLIGHRKNTSLR